MKDIKVLRGEIDLLSQLMLQQSREKLPVELVERFGKLIAFKKQELEDLENRHNSPFDTLQKSIDEIKRRLSIDFNLSYDYGFISSRNVKLQLEADNRGMVKARLGIPEGRICFETYCKYAHYQLEELVNYYYSLRFAGQEKELNAYFNKTEPDKQVKSISEISFNDKIYKLKSEFRAKNHFIISALNAFRNAISHRCTVDKTDEDSILILYKDVKNKGWHEVEKEERKLKTQGWNIEFRRKESFSELDGAFREYYYFLSQEITKLQK